MNNELYYLGFNLVAGIGPTRLNRLVERCGSVEAAWHADVAAMLAAGLDSRAMQGLLHAQAHLDLAAEAERIRTANVRLVTREDAAYPALLGETVNAPPLLYARGTLSPTDRWAIAIVGTRKPSSYGREVTTLLARDLAQAGVTIVSGLALGVDAVAHRAALQAGGRTIAVLGSGVDQPSPQTNYALGMAIIEQGALIAEYPLGTPPAAVNFPPRNRLISGMSQGVVVIEAGERSGALITVEFALEQNRDVFAVPGSIFSSRSQGTHQLIRSGAMLVRSADDILEALHMQEATAHQAVAAAVPATPDEAALLRLIEAEPRHVDAIGRDSTLPPPLVSATLAMLELKGLVKQVGVMEYVLAR